jgi:hypothetical protein
VTLKGDLLDEAPVDAIGHKHEGQGHQNRSLNQQWFSVRESLTSSGLALEGLYPAVV